MAGKIAVAVVGLFAYLTLEVWLGAFVGLWKTDLVTDTIFWIVASGFSFFIDATQAGCDRHFFLRHLIESLGVAVAIGFFINIFPLSLWAEVLLVPLLATLALTAQVAETEDEPRQVARYLNSILKLILLLLAFRVVVLLAKDWTAINKGELIRSFLLPTWLAIGLTPYVFLLAVVSSYEQLFLELKLHRADGDQIALKLHLAALIAFGLHPRRLQKFVDPWSARLAQTESFRSALLVVRAFLASTRVSGESDRGPSLASTLRAFSLKKFWAGGVLSYSIASALERENQDRGGP